MWSLTAAWGGFGGMVAKDWKERDALDRGDVRRGVRRRLAGARACACSRGSIRRCRRPASTTSSWCCRATRRPSRCSRPSGAVVGAGWQSGKFLYVDTDLKIDLPEARVVIDREQVADLGLDLAGVGQELGTLLGGALREPLQLLRPQLQGHPADRRRGPRHASARCSTSRSRRRAASSCRSRRSRTSRSSTAPRTLNRFQQRNAVRVFGGVQPGVTKEEGLRVLEEAARRGRRARRDARLRRRVAADPPRGLGADRDARLRGRADLPGARGAVPELPRSADRAARLGAARDLRRAGVQLPRPHHDQHLLAGRADHAGRA